MRARFLALILVLLAVLAVAYFESGPKGTPSTASVLNKSEVQAPIIGMSVGSAEGDYFLDVDAAIPYCQNFDRIVARRSGSEIEVVVINRVVGHGVVPLCAEGYRTTKYLTVNLGRGFEPGAVYTVLVNDQSLTFTPAESSASNESAIGPGFRSNRVGKAPQPIPAQFPPLMANEAEFYWTGAVARATESDPATYLLDVRVVGAFGCSEFRRVDLRQSGDRIYIRAVDSLNRWLVDAILGCDLLLPEEMSIDLGSDFESGVTYGVYASQLVFSENRGYWREELLTEFTAQ